MKTFLLNLLSIFVPFVMEAQTFNDTFSKTMDFQKKSESNAIIMANMNGSITIEGYDGNTVVVEAQRTINAKTNTALERAKVEVNLKTMDRADTMILYVQDGCNSYGKRSGKTDHDFINGWGYNWNCNNDCNPDYNYTVDVKIKVPRRTSVFASTVNEGEVVIENISGIVKARNVNGGIKLVGLTQEADAHTINGDLDVTYNSNPAKSCKFYSLNGDINAVFQKGLAATVSFESFNGDFFTNVNELKALPVEVTKTSNNTGVKFKVNGNRYQVGNGGALLDFETFNGNVYLKEL